MAREKEVGKEAQVDTLVISKSDTGSADVADYGETAQDEPRKPMATKRALIAWLVLCFSVSLVDLFTCQMLKTFRLVQQLEWPSVTSQQFSSPVQMSSDTSQEQMSLAQNVG